MAPTLVPSNLSKSYELALNLIIRVTSRFSISKKISSGYALALGVAVLGTSTGLIVGNHFQQQAKNQLENALRDSKLLSNLRVKILEVRSHQQEILALLRQPNELATEYYHTLEDVNSVKTLLAQIKSAQESSTLKALKPSLPEYETTVEEYNQQLKIVVERVNLLLTSQPPNRTAAQALIQDFISSTIALRFNYVSYQTISFLDAAYQQQQQANIALDNAEQMRTLVIAFSTLLSLLLAAILSIYTSKIIARPIQDVTQVAQRVTQEANFTLKAPVTTEDEVGTLATSLNQLIQWVSEYTHQLEEARQTLEHRVEERTEELKQKNQELEQTSYQLTNLVQNLKQTQTQLIQTEKMSSLGQMVAGVAHEINNPINFIYGNVNHISEYTQNLLELIKIYQKLYPQLDSGIAEHIEKIDLDFIITDLPKTLQSMKLGTERIRQIVLSLRNFSRLDEAEVKATNIQEGIDNTLLILNHRLQPEIEVIKQYGELPLIECYPAQVNQALMNIINNSIDALLDSDVSNKKIQIYTEKINLSDIQVRIRDNGSGIPKEIQDRLYDPFFTTKPVGKGTGLGLSICYQIVEKHQGEISFASEVGQGTEFTIKLPIKLSVQA